MTVFALIDGNSFYCSCERAFDPTLRGKPLVVLSNNDGCAIARTHEAKDLGVKMGEPWHLVHKKPELRSVIWKSSNYSLYGDMSRRMFDLLCELAPRVEPYSIDEMFLDFTGLKGDLAERCSLIRDRVRRVVKIPTCVGLGPTKTIAKLANKVAKGDRDGAGVCDLRSAEDRAAIYPDLPMSEVWGIGRASVAKLEKSGAQTIAEFVAMPDELVRQMLTVTGLRTLKELRGSSCMPFSEMPPTKKTLAVTRSFGRAITDWDEMREAVATYAARASEKMRRHGLVACAMQVFMRTNEFNSDPKYSNQITVQIEPTADSLSIIGTAVRNARTLWRDGFRYAKAGVIFVDLSRADDLPAQFFPSQDPARSESLMKALDLVNLRYGRDTLRPGGTAPKAAWSMRRNNLSPSYTTRADDMLKAMS